MRVIFRSQLSEADLARLRQLRQEEAASRWEMTLQSTLRRLQEVEAELKEMRGQLDDAQKEFGLFLTESQSEKDSTRQMPERATADAERKARDL